MLISCDFGGFTVDFGNGDSSSQAAAVPVEAGIDSPANGSTLAMGSVDISYHASSTEGVSAVELSIDGNVVSSIATPGSDQKVVALKYTWQPTQSGSHTIGVRAQNTAGTWSDYVTTMVSIAAAEEPQAAEPQAAVENTPEPTITPKVEATATPDVLTIFDIKHDKTKFYYGSNKCGSHELTISARVTQPEDVYALILFIRFADKESAAFTKWDSGRAMSKKSGDLYSVTLTSTKVTNYNAYEFAVMRYQIVAQDKAGNSIARTEVMEDLNIEVCPN
ncbi:hypothetical protein Pelsub_P0316 [Pelolinea submarina]|nr:hypothetical protein Pelsub_P0316 [Pelolinea submarina]